MCQNPTNTMAAKAAKTKMAFTTLTLLIRSTSGSLQEAEASESLPFASAQLNQQSAPSASFSFFLLSFTYCLFLRVSPDGFALVCMLLLGFRTVYVCFSAWFTKGILCSPASNAPPLILCIFLPLFPPYLTLTFYSFNNL